MIIREGMELQQVIEGRELVGPGEQQQKIQHRENLIQVGVTSDLISGADRMSFAFSLHLNHTVSAATSYYARASGTDSLVSHEIRGAENTIYRGWAERGI